MKKTAFIPARLILVLTMTLATLILHAQNRLPVPEWRLGTGILKGKIENYNPADGRQLELYRSNVFVTDLQPDKIAIAPDGTFRAEVQMFATQQYGSAMYGDLYLHFILTQGDSVSVSIDGNQATFSGPLAEVNNIACREEVWDAAHRSFHFDPANLPAEGTYYTLDEFYTRIRAWHKKCVANIRALDVPEAAKQWLEIYHNDCALINASWGANCLPQKDNGDVELGDEFIEFMKELDHNNTNIFYAGMLSYIGNMVLSGLHFKIENLYKICDKGINSVGRFDPQRFEEITDSLIADYLLKHGLDPTGPFRDAMFANRLNDIFENETPLDDRTLAQLETYPNKVLRDHYLAKNEELKRTLADRATKPLPTIHETPQTDGEQALADIIRQFDGKPVMIDFWGTWCGPCRSAIKEFEPHKEKFIERGVEFVYITDVKSPEDHWRNMTTGMQGHHYRLTQQQATEIFNKHSFTGWPSYIILDRRGQILHAKTGYHQELILQALEKALAE